MGSVCRYKCVQTSTGGGVSYELQYVYSRMLERHAIAQDATFVEAIVVQRSMATDIIGNYQAPDIRLTRGHRTIGISW